MGIRPKSPACRRYRLGIAQTMCGYVVTLLGVTYFLRSHHPAGAEAYVLAVLPAIPILCMLGVVGIYLRDEKDEFQRWMMICAMLWATGIMLAVTTVVGFLQMIAGITAPPAFYVFVLFWLVFGAVQCIQQIRSRRSDD